MVAYVNKAEPFNVTVNGCVQRQSFSNRTVIKLEVIDQDVQVLEKDSVRNMVQLKTITFKSPRISVVKPGAFRNVPRLAEVEFRDTAILEIPRGVFNQTSLERIHLSRNKIDTVFDFAFEDLPKLKEIDLSFNHLEHWNRNWFTNLNQLSSLDFQHNSIRSIPRQAFVNAKNLKNISLSFNDITDLHPSAFDGLYHLDYLGLRHNLIKDITPEAFPVGFSVTYLDFGANGLNFLRKELLARLTAQKATVFGNPWECSCLQRVKDWINRVKGEMIPSSFCEERSLLQCIVTHRVNFCDEMVNGDVTTSFLDELKATVGHVNTECFRLLFN